MTLYSTLPENGKNLAKINYELFNISKNKPELRELCTKAMETLKDMHVPKHTKSNVYNSINADKKLMIEIKIYKNHLNYQSYYPIIFSNEVLK